jgi:3-methyladenine DNA glycosylase Mpg
MSSDWQPYPREFYAQNARSIARELLGAALIRTLNGQTLLGVGSW